MQGACCFWVGHTHVLPERSREVGPFVRGFFSWCDLQLQNQFGTLTMLTPGPDARTYRGSRNCPHPFRNRLNLTMRPQTHTGRQAGRGVLVPRSEAVGPEAPARNPGGLVQQSSLGGRKPYSRCFEYVGRHYVPVPPGLHVT